jgi:hypothetical protein
MSKRFGILSENNNNNNNNNKKDNEKKTNEKKDNKKEDNLFKTNRFSSLNKEIINTETTNKKEKNNRFLILLEEEKEDNNYSNKVKPTLTVEKSTLTVEKSTLTVEKSTLTVEKPTLTVEKDSTILFPTLGKSNVTTTNSVIDFKTKLLEKDSPVIEKKVVEVKVINLTTDKESELAKQEITRRINKTMSQIVTSIMANGERQQRFYDSIYGEGMYNWEYEKMIDKYELLYGKNSWEDYTNMDIGYGYTSDSDYNYEDTNDMNNIIDKDVDYEKKLNNWL